MSDIQTGTGLDGTLGTVSQSSGDITSGVAMSGTIAPPQAISGDVATSLSLAGSLSSLTAPDGSVAIGNEIEGQMVGGPKGDTGATGPQGDPGVVQTVVAGTDISVDNSDPANPIITNTRTSAVWGNITGTLSAQTDLQTALNAKYNASNPSGYTTNTGTVTSVGVSVPTGLQVSGSPITTSGTAAITYQTGYQGYTTAEASKLSGIADGAEVNVRSDWNAAGGDAEILNKPTIPTKTSDLTNDSSFITSAGAPVQSVNSKTGTVSLTTADIADSLNKRYVTDAQKTVLGNTSGTNTGDQDLSGLVPKATTVNGQALSANITLDIDDVAPSQSGNSGKVLKTNGTTATWQTDSGGIASVVAGNNIDVDNTDPANPIVSVEALTVADITDFDIEVSNNTDVAANTSARHSAVTVTDSSEIDFTLTGQDITASIKAGSIDETKLYTSVNASLDLADSSVQPDDPITTLNATAHRTFYSDSLGDIAELAHGASGQVLTSGGIATPPSWQDSSGSLVTIDTKANILSSTPTDPTVAFASDTSEYFIYDGTNWKIASIRMSTELANPDSGYTQDNDKQGYGDDYIYQKRMYGASLGDYTDDPIAGAIKVTHATNPPLYQIYLRGRWNTLFYDLTMENGDFEHVPETYNIDVRSGNSNITGLNGQPIIREYKIDAGAYPREVIIDGGVL